MAEPQAMSTAWSSMRAASSAAPSAPKAGINRDLTVPATGALARIAIVTGSTIAWDIAIAASECRGLAPEDIAEPQPPHQQDRTEYAVLIPAPPRRNDACSQAKRGADALEALAQRHV